MLNSGRVHPVRFILIFYTLCFVLRGIEYFVIRTDQTVLGEAFIHKLAGIALLALALWLLQYSWTEIGFRADKAVRGILLGMLLGGGAFVIAYGVEMLLQASSGNPPSLQFYVTSYAIQGNRAMQTGLAFILICILGNLINVVMEEGVFRGLFLRLMEEKYSFTISCLFSSVLFGFWHVVQPIRNVADGEQSAMGALMAGVLLVTTSTLLAIQLCMLVKITGALWAGMAAHFINNASINLLHVVTASGVDELQTLRIAIAQSLSFVVVTLFFVQYVRRKKANGDKSPYSANALHT